MRPLSRTTVDRLRHALRAGMLLTLSAALLGPPRPAPAQDAAAPEAGRVTRQPKPPPVNMAVTAGCAKATRTGRTTAVRVVLDNGERPVSGRLELRDPSGVHVTAMPVELPRRAHKEYTLFARLAPDPNSGPSPAELTLYDGRKPIVRQALELSFPEGGTLVISSTGEGSGLLYLNDETRYRTLPQGKRIRVAQFAPQDLPHQWPGYEPADAVVLDGLAWTRMDAEQRRAFRVWVEAGGHAVLCGEATDTWRDPDGLALAGVVPRDLASLESVACLRGYSPSRLPLRAGAGKLLTVSGPLAPGAHALLTEAGRPLVVERRPVAGRVLWIGFDPFRETVRNWDGFDRFWRATLDEAAQPMPVLFPSPGNVALARTAASALPRLPVPPLPAIIGFGVLYAAIFGPLNIWMLRRLRRTVRSWLVMPGLAAAMTLVVLFAGQLWGNARTVLNSLSILQAASGGRTAVEQSLTGLFSPTNRAFDLATDDPAPELRDLGLEEGSPVDAQALPWPDLQTDGGVRWEAVALQLFSVRMLEQQRPRELGGSVDVSLDGRRAGTVRNGTFLALKRAYLYQDKRYCWLGDLESGASVPVRAGGWKPSLRPDAGGEDNPGGELQENRKFRESARALWREAPAQLLAGRAGRGAWLIAELPDYRGGLQVEGVPYNNRSALMVVQVPPGATVRTGRGGALGPAALRMTDNRLSAADPG